MKSISITLLLALALFSGTTSFDSRIEGCVTDEAGEALIYANVLVKGTEVATVTDLEGCFRIAIPNGATELTFTYPGYEEHTAPIPTDGEPMRISMRMTEVVEEVVTTAYATGEARRSTRTRELSAPVMTAAPASMEAAPPPPPPPPAVHEEVPAMMAAPERTVSKSVAVESTSSHDAPASYLEGPADDMPREDAFMRGEAERVEVEGDGNRPDAGQLTAGEVNDFSKWDMWADMSQEDLARHRSGWRQYANHRYTLQLTNTNAMPVVNAAVQLRDGQGNVLWKARTDHAGRAELWAHFFQEVERPNGGLEISGEADGRTFRLTDVTPFEKGINFHELPVACNDIPMIDVAFVVDATGSMSDEIRYLQAELSDVVQRVKDSLPEADLQLGSVFYRDKGEEYLTRHSDFAADPQTTIRFIQEQAASGGGDTPEAVEDALEAAVTTLKWRDEATTRLLFLVLDAPPHQEEEAIKRMQVLSAKAAAEGIQIIPVACSGIDKSTEYLMRCLALASNGTYTFLTDHSGIGNAHIEPSTDSYEVEHLNDLMARLIVQFSSLTTCELPVADVDDPSDELPPRALGFAASPEEAGWKYFPNPTAGPLTLDFEGEGGTLFLADANGKLLRRYEEPKLQGQLDLSNYPAGSYWLRYDNGEGEWSQGRVLVVRR